MTTDYAIETNGLQKIYRNRWRGREFTAVAGLSLRVPAGTKYGLLGANGAGKTTFVKMLLSAVGPTAGRASLFGRDSREPESRRPVGYLPENHRFPTYFTGAGMLDFYGALSGMSAGDRKRRSGELLGAGRPGRLGRRTHQEVLERHARAAFGFGASADAPAAVAGFGRTDGWRGPGWPAADTGDSEWFDRHGSDDLPEFALVERSGDILRLRGRS